MGSLANFGDVHGDWQGSGGVIRERDGGIAASAR